MSLLASKYWPPAESSLTIVFTVFSSMTISYARRMQLIFQEINNSPRVAKIFVNVFDFLFTPIFRKMTIYVRIVI